MTLHIYMGYDAVDHLAYRVAEQSILSQTRVNVEIHPLRDFVLRTQSPPLYWRTYSITQGGQKIDDRDDTTFSTDFSYSRFLVPYIHATRNREGPCLFVDADVMFRAPVEDLFDCVDGSGPLQVVQHRMVDKGVEKIAGLRQHHYPRKNWSSVMLFANPSWCAKALPPQVVSNKHRNYLHGFEWLADYQIGGLPEEWNWLEGYSSPDIDPKLVHYTRGTPDLDGYHDAAFAYEYWRHAADCGWTGHNIL